jgi:hypothetical protein
MVEGIYGETRLSNKPCIGLFGTCGDSKWRDAFIFRYDNLQINYYNPQVADWKPEDAAIEADHLINDDIILFPVTNETYGIGTLAEIGFSIISVLRSTENRFVIIYIDTKLSEALIANNAVAVKESMHSRMLVLAHLKKIKHPNVFLVDSLDEMLGLSVKLYDNIGSMKNIRNTYHKG